MKAADRDRPIRRFDLHERLQHITLLASMTLLGMTALPRAFPTWPTAQWWISLFGGVEKAGVAHHYIGYVLDFTIFYHLLYLLFRTFILDKKPPLSMAPTVKDAKDFLHSVLYIMGIVKEEPKYERFGYGAKIDYWVLVVGAPLLAATGIGMFHAEVLERFFPPVLIAVLVATHTGLALFLATFIIVVHLYYAVLAPEIFPLNTSIYTGILSPSKYKQLFAMDYLRIMRKRGALKPGEEEELKDMSFSEYFELPLLRLLKISWSTLLKIVLFAGTAVAAGILMIVAGFWTFDYMDRPEFCTAFGCHSMEPEFQAHSVPPHARVDCANCHTGKGIEWAAKMRLVTAGREMLTQYVLGYEQPIPVTDLRPARETCEECHWPAKFSGARLRINHRFAEDGPNTEKISAQLFKVGRGDVTDGSGIHWHMATKVWYLPLDEHKQEIGWVGVERGGKLVEFTDPSRASEITPERIAGGKRIMDCIDCHNRAGHTFGTPADLVDRSLALGKIDVGIPFVKQKAVELMKGKFETPEEAAAAMERLADFYKNSYPDVYEKKRKAIADAVAQLKRLVGVSIFPDLQVDSSSYRSNLGHLNSPGCLRCHGKLVASSAGAEPKLISNDCNLCHVFLPQDIAETLAGRR